MTSPVFTILLVDDHSVVRAGFRYLLSEQYQHKVLEAESAEQAYTIYREHQPDLVVMDIAMPGIGGLEGIRRLQAFNDESKIIVLSMRDDPGSVAHAMAIGANGYLSKNCDPDELAKAIKKVMRGEQYFSSDIQFEQGDTPESSQSVASLTKREYEVFQRLANGESVNSIAEILGRSVKTINNHRSHIMEKLGAENTTQLALIAMREGVLHY